MTEQKQRSRAEFDLPSISAPAVQEPARLVVAPPLANALAHGLAVIQYRADNLRIVRSTVRLHSAWCRGSIISTSLAMMPAGIGRMQAASL